MVDRLGKELGEGDEVIYMTTGRNPDFGHGHIESFKGQYAVIKTKYGTQRKMPHKIVKLKS